MALDCTKTMTAACANAIDSFLASPNQAIIEAMPTRQGLTAAIRRGRNLDAIDKLILSSTMSNQEAHVEFLINLKLAPIRAIICVLVSIVLVFIMFNLHQLVDPRREIPYGRVVIFFLVFEYFLLMTFKPFEAYIVTAIFAVCVVLIRCYRAHQLQFEDENEDDEDDDFHDNWVFAVEDIRAGSTLFAPGCADGGSPGLLTPDENLLLRAR